MPERDDTTVSENPPHATEGAYPLVLVVEDDKLTHRLLQRFLEKADMRYIGVETPHQAFELLENEAPDLILSDIQMPEMDGIAFCAKLRKTERFKDVPLIFFTSLQDMDTMSRAFDSGANDYVVKPIRQVEVVSRAKRHIREYLQKKEAARKIETLNHQNESKNRFLGVASHDLRNPLVSIRGMSHFLSSQQFGELNESQKEMVATIVEASEAMLKLVEDLLDISKIESGQIKTNKEAHRLGDVARYAITLHQPTASNKQIALQLVNECGEPTLDIDKTLINRVIDNLVSNAIKFSPANTTITVRLHEEADSINLSIEDQGPGIPPDEFDKLFREFGKTSNLPTAGESSSGIGLFVSQRIAKSHGAEILARNLEQGGACFSLKFPKRAQ